MSVWDVGEEDGLVAVKSKIVPSCDYCKSKLRLADFKLRSFALGEKIGRALDMSYLCPECKNEEMFGIAVSKEEYGLFERLSLI